ncbi:MAG: 50S ribosomal protein L11 methyltransferase [Candidatus Omnitrophica bacterium]|nr:50S ribosomal protein L11 methyltransferase [Candidatus Omnitrophota bacterium]
MTEIRVSFVNTEPAGIELLRRALVNAGAREEDLVESAHKGRVYLSLFLRSRARAEKLGRQIRSLRIRHTFVSLVPLKGSDWKTRWKKYFRPFTILPGIRIIPSEAHPPQGRPAPGTIYLDTTLAFGTGQHATTHMMAQLIASQKNKFSSFFDVGTGSGVLSLVAACCGAKAVTAIDIDAHAIKTARKNFLLNRCPVEHAGATGLAQFPGRGKFDFVAANLLTEDLIKLQEKLICRMRPRGWLAVSGIYYENFPFFKKHFTDRRLRTVRVLKRKNWYALLFRKA